MFGLFLLILFTGCAGPPNNHAIVWSRDLAYAEPLWRAELAYHGHTDVLIVVCHGNKRQSDGAWIFTPDKPFPRRTVQEVVDFLLDINPKQTIALLTCNPGGSRLSLTKPGATVLYATTDLWAVPGTGPPGKADRACELVVARP